MNETFSDQMTDDMMVNHFVFFFYLAVSAPLVIRVLISSSWPYLAATWRGVLPYLSTQSISPPDGKQGIREPLERERKKAYDDRSLQVNQTVLPWLPFWMRI